VGVCLAVLFTAGTETWGPPTPAGENGPAAPGPAEVDRPVMAILHGAAEKRRLAVEVADGRLGLLEAAAHFRAIDRQTPQFSLTGFRTGLAGACDEERYCREVIGYLRWSQPAPVTDGTDRVGLLEAELRELLDRGDLQLPPVQAAAGPP
jgi:hypothetical protein